jgi:hypothetical protein
MDLMTTPTGRAARRATLLAALLCVGAPLALGAQNGGTKDAKAKQAKAKEPKAPPDSATIAKWKVAAEALPLFKSADPVVFTLVADFKTVLKDRDTLSTKEYPATVILGDSGAVQRKIPVTLRTRGHFRLSNRNCSFVPLRINFPKSELKGTVFAGQDKVKLGTHCQDRSEYEQYVLREQAAYRVQNILTERSFRSRLARVTYVDSVAGKSLGTHNGILFENEDDVASRMGGQVVDLRGALFDDVDHAQMNAVSIFEYFVGNTDWSLYALHNIRLVRTPKGVIYPVAYDLDFSGLVSTRYATPDYHLPIHSVKDRMYRGPCRTVEDLEPQLTVYREKQAQVLAAYDSVPDLDPRYVKDAQSYLTEFFKMIEKPRDVKFKLVDACEGKPTA